MNDEDRVYDFGDPESWVPVTCEICGRNDLEWAPFAGEFRLAEPSGCEHVCEDRSYGLDK